MIESNVWPSINSASFFTKKSLKSETTISKSSFVFSISCLRSWANLSYDCYVRSFYFYNSYRSSSINCFESSKESFSSAFHNNPSLFLYIWTCSSLNYINNFTLAFGFINSNELILSMQVSIAKFCFKIWNYQSLSFQASSNPSNFKSSD